MRHWETELVIVKEVEFDHDLHAFEVYDNADQLLDSIHPSSLEEMETLIESLDQGACPIADSWEDGLGNTCTLDGWGKNSSH